MTDCTTSVILGTVLGVLFLLTCIISAVKAVRDRKRIKRRTAQSKHKAEDEYRLSNFTDGASLNSSNGHASDIMRKGQSSVQTSRQNDNAYHSTFRTEEKQGIENKTFTELNDEILSKACALKSNCLPAEPTEEYLDNAGEKRHPFYQLSTKCTTIKTVSRRNSYKKAVEHNSVIPHDPLSCASSTILYTCDYDNPSTKAFENKAFDLVGQ
ncbi:hypothetical protein ACJMK2_036329 [Sinanodonta woodiana]|uniref:Uncharacterized protein n=1 Tax=Sinanodonta woodiana TaxID=1069815 RepID=A0ABD3WI16_SINWO